jgi:hypothetical protein
MGLEKITHLDKTIISIHEPTRYGERDIFREKVIAHDPALRQTLPTISRERIENPLNDPRGEGVEEMVSIEIPKVGTVIFVKHFDTEEWGSATYRSGAHIVDGPYLLKD